ncbi:T-cell surface antigen CD2 [Esox lucius]|uniref:T-cell surface antigen CD2 n=1 Tax=Esox lucius TaxID=8010 RepID=UPI001476C6AA|nr:T-cell surface antigen CD2 [Esox lucius]
MDPRITVCLVMSLATQVRALACNLSQKNGSHQCYGVSGEPLYLHLIANSNNEGISLKKGDTIVLKSTTKSSKLTLSDEKRSEFLNGTFRLNEAMRKDSGDYTIEIHDTRGKLLRLINMQLDIQVPVSPPMLFHICVRHEEAVGICISDGDDLQYSWTLNSQILNSGVPYNVVKLKNNDTGELTCIVQNNVSSQNSTIVATACQDVSSQFLFLAVTLAVVLTVTLISLLKLFNHIRKKQRCRCDTSDNGNNEHVVYADVRVNKQRKQTKKQSSATEIEYGQMKNTRRGRQPIDTF